MKNIDGILLTETAANEDNPIEIPNLNFKLACKNPNKEEKFLISGKGTAVLTKDNIKT